LLASLMTQFVESNKLSKRYSVHVWVPGLDDTGGIQHYSICLIRALVELMPSTHVVVSSKGVAEPIGSLAGASVRSFGRWHPVLRTPMFVVSSLFLAWCCRPNFVLVTHPHFTKGASLAFCPLLVVSHGIDVWGRLKGYFRLCMSLATGHLPVSRFTEQVLISEGEVEADRCMVVPDTFREEEFSPGAKPNYLLKRYGLEADQPVLLTVGRLSSAEAYKGQDQVIEALPLIRQRFPNVRYIIAGRGDDEARLRGLVKGFGQEDAVIFAGFVPDEELADHYRLCDAFVMPSTGEGFGIVYLEAIGCGRPCVAGNLDASPEALGDGRWGFVVDPRSPREIADAVVKIVSGEHDKPWLKEPETLRAEVVERYGFAAFKSSLRAALEQLVPDFVKRCAE
jgi:glycosyltransferase involved in cell wall biosynthesis